MKHSPSQPLISSSLKKLRLIALACGMFLFMGTSAYAQQKPTPCASNPVSLAKAYVGYNGLTNQTAALYSWCQNETKANIQTYCSNLEAAIEGVQNPNSLSDGCKVEIQRRKQELEVIGKLVDSRH